MANSLRWVMAGVLSTSGAWPGIILLSKVRRETIRRHLLRTAIFSREAPAMELFFTIWKLAKRNGDWRQRPLTSALHLTPMVKRWRVSGNLIRQLISLKRHQG